MPAPIAKLARPQLSGTFTRDRLFRLLDEGRKRPVTWVAAPAGSGKTTLAASYLDARKLPCLWYQVDEGDGDLAGFFYYLGLAAKSAAPKHKTPLPLLTPEYLQGIPAFTRRYFERLFSRLKPPSVVVFDNYQDAPLHSGFHEMFAHALDAIPEGVNVLVLSRGDAPAQLARLGANGKLHRVGWNDVRFTLEESRELLGKHGLRKPPAELVELLHTKADGWAAGLVLLTAGAGESGIEPHALDGLTAGGIFDYFATEIFDRTDGVIQDVLLKTSLLQKITASAAERLTGTASAGRILEQLSRDHYFTTKHVQTGVTYQYHPLFRGFLGARARETFSRSDHLALQKKAAALMEESGQIGEAAGLFIDAGEWSGVTRIILEHAPALLSQGRSSTLDGWLNRLPSESIDGSPWMLYWRGICRMAFDPGESRRWLERAFDSFRRNLDMVGAFLSWSSIIDTFLYEWSDFSGLDRWVAVLEGLLAEHPDFPSAEIEARVAAGMFIALAWRRPQHPRLAFWEGKAFELVLSGSSVQLRVMLANHLLFHHLWNGEFAKTSIIIDALRPLSRMPDNDPLTQQTWWVMEAMHSWFMADHPTCVAAVNEGNRLAERTGVHLLDVYLNAQGVYSGVSLDDPETARACLRNMAARNPSRPLDRSLHHYMASQVAWMNGDLINAGKHGEIAVKLARATHSTVAIALCEIELATVLFDTGRLDDASDHLGRGVESARGSNHLEFLCQLHASRFALETGRDAEGVELLRGALGLGASQGYLNIPRWNSTVMSRLCAKALERGIEPAYVRKLIAVHDVVPPPSEDALESWPWPVRIHALGRFEILTDDETLTVSGKVQRKPLEMLKLAIALGSVNVAAEGIAEALWPDAEGDLAHRSFDTTLYRLRKLIGNEKALRLQEGLLTLDRRYCRVDAWEFERLAQRVEAGGESAPLELADKAIDMYLGHFLPFDEGLSWSMPARERLRKRFSRLIIVVGTRWEAAGRWDKALACFERGLERDELVEDFYQHLMMCHLELGQQVQAASIYDRCRSAMRRVFGRGPSAKTEALHARMAGCRRPPE
jgi:LuxR family transcriptional regulator, maltose regulon positive regulatory protein